MDAMRFGKMRSTSGGRGHRRASAWRVVGVVVVSLVALALVPAGASAETLCTDTWVGGSSGLWKVESNWSTGHVPSSSDVVCIGSGSTVEVTTQVGNAAGVLAVEGTLVLAAGSLEVASSPRSVGCACLEAHRRTEQAITGAGTIDVTSNLEISGEPDNMTGPGSFVLKSGASGTINVGTPARLQGRSLVNEGTLTWAAGAIFLEEERKSPTAVRSMPTTTGHRAGEAAAAPGARHGLG